MNNCNNKLLLNTLKLLTIKCLTDLKVKAYHINQLKLHQRTFSTFFPLPKIHKNPISYRPLIQSHKSYTQTVSDTILPVLMSLLAKTINSNFQKITINNPTTCPILTSSFELVHHFNNMILIQPTIKQVPVLITADFSNLYNSIRINDARQSLTSLLSKFTPMRSNTELFQAILSAFNFISNHNYISVQLPTTSVPNNINNLVNEVSTQHTPLSHLNNNTNIHDLSTIIVHQVDGLAQGCSASPPLANITLLHYERKNIKNIQKHFPTIYRRFYDDIFAIVWVNIETSIENIIKHYSTIISSFYPSYLKVSVQASFTDIVFLDLHIFLKNEPQLHLEYQPYKKTVHTRSLPFFSNHDLHVKRNVVSQSARSLLLRSYSKQVYQRNLDSFLSQLHAPPTLYPRNFLRSCFIPKFYDKQSLLNKSILNIQHRRDILNMYQPNMPIPRQIKFIYDNNQKLNNNQEQALDTYIITSFDENSKTLNHHLRNISKQFSHLLSDDYKQPRIVHSSLPSYRLSMVHPFNKITNSNTA
jgi:hypothetical protein